VIRQQVLPGILWPERKSAPGGYSAKFEGGSVRIKNRPKDILFDMVELSLTLRGFLRRQMLCFFLFRIGHCLGPRGAATGRSLVLRLCAKGTRNADGKEQHAELFGKSISHGQLS
jgi:hypothetical protein